MNLVIALLIIHFAAGAAGIFLINRKTGGMKARAGWEKYFVYLGLTAVVIAAANIHIYLFTGLCIAIFCAGLFEILRTANLECVDPHPEILKLKALGVLIVSAALFSVFILLPRPIIIYVYVVVVIFDGASQVLGQLFGKKRILPVISPGKTLEGLAGGTASAVATAVLLHDFAGLAPWQAVLPGLLICIAAFAGDAAASAYKRAFNIKDFGNILPGQGGILDRYDSFIASGAVIGLASMFFIDPLQDTDKNIAAYLGYSVAYMIILMAAEAVYVFFRIRPEYLRMATHVLCGAVSLFMPLLFSSAWFVVFICLQSAGFIFLTKRMRILDSHHSVERETYGSSFFFLGLLASYLISRYTGDLSVFYISTAVLTVSDPLAALAGFSAGRLSRKAQPASRKTFTGSAAFLISAFLILAAGIEIFHEYSLPGSMLTAILVAIPAMIAEAFFYRGTDNISVPVVVSVILAMLP